MSLQMLKKAMIAYVASSMKAVWSVIAHPLSIIGKKNCDVADYRIYGNSVQEGTPTPETPIEVQSVGELTTKNLFGYIKGVGANLTIVEALESGDIVAGKSADDHVNSYSSGWYRPGVSESSGVCPILHTGDIVTVSADITLIELRRGTEYKTNIYLFSREQNTGFAPSATYSIGVGETVRYARTYTITEKFDGNTLYPVIPVNGNVVKIENIQIEYGAATEYEPYHKYKIPVTVRGKNLYDKETYPMTDGMWVHGETGNLSSGSSFSVTSYIPCNSLQRKTITLSPTGGQNPGVAFYDADKIFISGKAYKQQNTCTVEVPSNAMFMRVSAPIATKEIFQIAYSEIEPQTINIFADEPLRKVGDYADCVDFGKGVVLRNVGKRIFTGEENMQELGLSNTSYLYRYAMGVTEMANLYSDRILMSNYFATGDYLDIRDNPSPVVGILSVSRIAFSTSIPTKEAFKLWIAELYGSNPLYVCYPLSTPIEEPILLPKLPQFKGTTIYEVQADIPPSGVEVCYYG